MANSRRKQEEELEKFEFDFDECNLYDDTALDLVDDGIKVMPGLTDEEIYDAAILAKYFWSGLILITGDPGSGKDLLVKSLCYKFKRYFGRTILLDDRPTSVFGRYIPFNENTLKREIITSDLISSGKLKEKEDVDDLVVKQECTDSFKEWLEAIGPQKLRGGVLGLTEFWRYMHKRRPMARMNIALAGIIRVWRHLGITIFGICQMKEDLDEFTCLPFVTTEVRCTWGLKPDTTRANIYRLKYVSDTQVFQMADPRPVSYFVNGGLQRPELGVRGKNKRGEIVYYRYFDLFNSRNATSMGMAKF